MATSDDKASSLALWALNLVSSSNKCLKCWLKNSTAVILSLSSSLHSSMRFILSVKPLMADVSYNVDDLVVFPKLYGDTKQLGHCHSSIFVIVEGVVPTKLQHLLCHCCKHFAHVIYVDDLSDCLQGHCWRVLLPLVVSLVSLNPVTFKLPTWSDRFGCCCGRCLLAAIVSGFVVSGFFKSLRERTGLGKGELLADFVPLVLILGGLRTLRGDLEVELLFRGFVII